MDYKPIKDTIITKRGIINLEKLRIGDEILGKNSDGSFVFYKVNEVAFFQPASNRHWIIINDKYKFAPQQSIYVNKKLIHAKDIKLGDFLEGINGENIRVDRVIKAKDKCPKIKLKIDTKRSWLDRLFGRKKQSTHTYFINGILVHNASRYWVGGTGTWDATSTTHWSASSGGGSGASVPTSSDDAIFDASSGTTTCTLSGTIPCANFDASATSLLTFAGTTTGFRVYGNFTLKTGMTWSHNGQINFYATTTGKTVTTAGISLSAALYFGGGGAGGGWQFQDAVVSTRQIFLIAGTLDTNNQNVTCTTGNTGDFGFSGASGNTRVLTLGSSTITTNNLALFEDCRATCTFNYNTSTIDCVNPSSTANVGGYTFYNLKFRLSTSNYGADVSVEGDPTITNDLTIDGYNTQYRLPIRSSVIGTQRTITANNIVSLTNCDFRDIVGAGSATWSGTSIGDQLNNSGITFTSPVTRYWVGNGGSWGGTTHWSASSGGASGASMPIAQDTAIFDSNSFSSGSQTVTVDVRGAAGNLDFTNVTNSPALIFNLNNSIVMEIYGTLTLKSGMTWTSNNSVVGFYSRSSINLASVGITINQPIRIEVFGATFTLSDNLTMGSTRTLTFNNGTFDANNKDISIGAFSSNNSNIRTLLMGTGTWTLKTTGTIWNISTSSNLTLTPSTSTIIIDDASATSKTFGGGGKTYNAITFSGDNIIVSGTNTFTTMNVNNAGLTNGLKFGANQVVTNFTTNGSVGNLAKLLSSVNGTQRSISKSSGVVSVNFMSIQDSNATGGATWYAGAGSTSVSNNSGWLFSNAPITFTFLIDGLIATRSPKEFTIDGIIQATQIIAFTGDGIIIEQTLKTFTVDGIILTTILNAFTIDGIILRTYLKTFTIDGLIKTINDQTFTIDGIIFSTSSKTFTIDGIILRIYSQLFTIDGIILTIVDNSFTIDGIIFATNLQTFTVDGIIFGTTLKTFTIDGIMKEINFSSFTIDGIILRTYPNTFTIDGIMAIRPLPTFTIDGIILATSFSLLTVDGIIAIMSIYGVLYGFYLDGVKLSPKTITREYIFQKTDMTSINGKTSRDRSSRKEKFMLSFENQTKKQIDDMIMVIAQNEAVRFTVDGKDIVIIDEICFPYIGSIVYNTVGNDYLASTQLELIVEE